MDIMFTCIPCCVIGIPINRHIVLLTIRTATGWYAGSFSP